MPSEDIRSSHLIVVVESAYVKDVLAGLLANHHVGRQPVGDVLNTPRGVTVGIKEVPATVLVNHVRGLLKVLGQDLIQALLVGLTGRGIRVEVEIVRT